jgi:hypothetical protein
MFEDSSRLYDQIIMMVMMTAITPLVAATATAVASIVKAVWPKVWEWIKTTFGPKYYSVSIKK